MWKCPNCGKDLEEQFDGCWKCGTAKAKTSMPTEARVFCTRCGKQVSQSDAFCRSCGESLPDGQSLPPIPSVGSLSVPVKFQNPYSGKKAQIAGVIVMWVGIVVGSVGCRAGDDPGTSLAFGAVLFGVGFIMRLWGKSQYWYHN